MDNPEFADVEWIVNSGRYTFKKGQIRHFLSNRHKNGLDKATYKIGKRIYFKIPSFDAWIEKQKGGRS